MTFCRCGIWGRMRDLGSDHHKYLKIDGIHTQKYLLEG